MDLTAVSLPAITGLLGVVLTLYFTNRREAKRQEHERTMKLREERREAYAAMAKITKFIEATAPHTDTDLGQALAELELLTENTELIEAAENLVQVMAQARGKLWDLKDAGFKQPYRAAGYLDAEKLVGEQRAGFLRLAKGDLKYKQERSLWRRFFGFE